jgi:hypothetical protein
MAPFKITVIVLILYFFPDKDFELVVAGVAEEIFRVRPETL